MNISVRLHSTVGVILQVASRAYRRRKGMMQLPIAIVHGRQNIKIAVQFNGPGNCMGVARIDKYILLHESEWNMARYFTSVYLYFHEPKASGYIVHE